MEYFCRHEVWSTARVSQRLDLKHLVSRMKTSPAFRERIRVQWRIDGSGRIPAVKSPLCLRLCLVAVVTFSLCGCELFAGAGEPPSAIHAKAADEGTSSPKDGMPPVAPEFMIAGSLRSFERMAGISQKAKPEQILPLLSRNVFMQGYEGSSRPTEFLILLRRYVVQARELAALASSNGMTIRVSN